MIYFDFEKAFNCVPYLRMLHKFNEFGIPGSLHSWIQSFLSKRTILVNIGEEHTKYIGVVSDFPQGSLLTRFSLLCKNDCSQGLLCDAVMFAEDAKT